jgi:hypothetical protein
VLLMTGAALGDRLGRKRVFIAGMGLFVVVTGPLIGTRIRLSVRSDTDRGSKFADEFRASVVSQPV